MAEEILVKESLAKEMIEAGAELTRKLDEADVDVQASLWLYLVEPNLWRLVIAEPKVRTDGAMRIYKTIQSLISKIPEDQPKVMLKDISVLETNAPLISALRKLRKTRKKLAGMRLSREYVNGQFIEDAYVYRMK